MPGTGNIKTSVPVLSGWVSTRLLPYLYPKKTKNRGVTYLFTNLFLFYCLCVICRNLRSYLLGDVPLDGAENVGWSLDPLVASTATEIIPAIDSSFRNFQNQSCGVLFSSKDWSENSSGTLSIFLETEKRAKSGSALFPRQLFFVLPRNALPHGAFVGRSVTWRQRDRTAA